MRSRARDRDRPRCLRPRRYRARGRARRPRGRRRPPLDLDLGARELEGVVDDVDQSALNLHSVDVERRQRRGTASTRRKASEDSAIALPEQIVCGPERTPRSRAPACSRDRSSTFSTSRTVAPTSSRIVSSRAARSAAGRSRSAFSSPSIAARDRRERRTEVMGDGVQDDRLDGVRARERLRLATLVCDLDERGERSLEARPRDRVAAGSTTSSARPDLVERAPLATAPPPRRPAARPRARAAPPRQRAARERRQFARDDAGRPRRPRAPPSCVRRPASGVCTGGRKRKLNTTIDANATTTASRGPRGPRSRAPRACRRRRGSGPVRSASARRRGASPRQASGRPNDAAEHEVHPVECSAEARRRRASAPSRL